MAATAELIGPIAFTLVLLPALIVNLRKGTLPNWASLVVLTGGVAFAILICEPSIIDSAYPWFLWIGGFVVLLALAAVGFLPAGIAKLMAAMLPWFCDPALYMGAVTVAFLGMAAVGFARKDKLVPVVPAFLVTGAAALALPVV